MDLPKIGNVEPAVLALLGTWLFSVVQFAKGRLWADKWTTGVALSVPFVLGGVLVYGGESASQYLQVVAVLSLLATGVWAVNKAANNGKE